MLLFRQCYHLMANCNCLIDGLTVKVSCLQIVRNGVWFGEEVSYWEVLRFGPERVAVKY